MLATLLVLQLLTLVVASYIYARLSWRCRRIEKWAQIIHADVVNSEHRENTAKAFVDAVE